MLAVSTQLAFSSSNTSSMIFLVHSQPNHAQLILTLTGIKQKTQRIVSPQCWCCFSKIFAAFQPLIHEPLSNPEFLQNGVNGDPVTVTSDASNASPERTHEQQGNHPLSPNIQRFHWPASLQINWNKIEHLHKKRVQLPQDWFRTPTWLPFHRLGTPIWLPWRHVKTLYPQINSLNWSPYIF